MNDGRVPVPRSQVTVKTAATVAVTAAGVVAALYLVVHARFALTLIAASLLIAIALHHLVDQLVRVRVPRGWAIGFVALSVLAFLAAISVALIPPAVRQVRALIGATPKLLESFRHSHLYAELDRRFELEQHVQGLTGEVPRHLQQGVDALLAALTGLATVLGAAVTVFFLALFMVGFGGPLIRRWLEETLPERRERYRAVLAKIYHSIGGYLGGLALVCLTNATATTIFLAILGVPFFLPLGLMSGLSSLLPMVGNTLAGILISLIALATGGLWQGVATAAFFILYQQFENHVLGPIVYRRAVKLNPLLVILGVILFADLGGMIGAIVAVPAIAAGQVVLRELLALRRERLGLIAPGARQRA